MFVIPFADSIFLSIKKNAYDSWVDKLSYYVTSLLLLLFATIVAGKQYIGSPIQCWVPAQFAMGWMEYAEDYCFVQNTYFVPMDGQIPQNTMNRKEAEIGYYQWVPMILAFQSFMFHLPCWFWMWLCGLIGIQMDTIMTQASLYGNSLHFTGCEERKNAISVLASYLEETLNLQLDPAASSKKKGYVRGIYSWLKRHLMGRTLCCFYLLIKFFYVLNIVVQLFLTNWFLVGEWRLDGLWGGRIVGDLIAGRDWSKTGIFPRVTMCDFTVKELGQTRTYTVQCVLMINLLNEVIYIILWFWFLFLGFCAILDLLAWIFALFFFRKQPLVRYLRINQTYNDNMDEESRRIVVEFVEDVIHPDGSLILFFVGSHAGEIVALELTGQLWQNFEKKYYDCTFDEAVILIESNQVAGKVSERKKTEETDQGFSETMYSPTSASKYPDPPATEPDIHCTI